MIENHKWYEVTEYCEDGKEYYTVAKKEDAERLYRKLRARGVKAYIKQCEPKIKGVEK